MELKNIIQLLTTITQYHTVTITQTFSRTETDWITVRCLPETKTLELTYIQNQTVEYHTSIDEAAKIISDQINSPIPS